MTVWSIDYWPAFFFRWSVMIAAMMFPTLVPQARVVAIRSLWARRTQAVLLFLAGYSALWLLYGAMAEVALGLLHRFVPAAFSFLLPVSILLAALWQLTRHKQKSLVACHFTMPIAPSGWQANLDCCRYGARTAASCCASCWALMLVCAVADHTLWAMLVVALVSLFERIIVRPRQLWFALALGVISLFTLLTQAL
jgi:predicted metal-binding membrane protein